MILFHISEFWIAFNWNPLVKREQFFRYSNSENVTLLDLWKFRICNFKKEKH